MTTEEIKEQVSMTSLLFQYGIEVKRGMCKCPFHNDRSPSMKVYKDGCHCFTCSKSWDVFSFVQEYENCDFKTAFINLGGTYKGTLQTETDRILAQRRYAAQKEAKQRAKAENDKLRKMLLHSFQIVQSACEFFEPYSEGWCTAKNEYPIIEHYLELFISGEEVNKQDVYRRYRKLKSRYIDV